MNRKKITVPLILGILILSSSSGLQLSPWGVQAAHAESTRIVGYFPQWESGDLNSIDYSQVTDIIYFHIWPNPDGSLDTSDVNFSDLEIITSEAHAAGVNVLIAAGGWGVSDGFPTMAQDNNSRANFVQNVKSFITANNLDGIDIDWETPIDSVKIDNQDILLADLASELHPIGKLVTVAVNGDVVELKSTAANSVDWINVMAYDMNWNNAEHSTFEDSISALQRYENAGIPKDKLDLGIPFYGRNDGWTSALKYEDIVASCSPAPSENYCNNHFFNGIQLVQQKSQYVLDNGYDGVMVWNLGQDTYDQTSLLKTINETLSGQPLPDLQVHLENLEMSKTGKNRWTGTATITVFDENEATSSGVTVQGSWSGGANGSESCVTDSSGQCNVSKSTKKQSLTFTVDDLTGNRISYDSSANHIENTITIYKDGDPVQNTPPISDAGGPYSGAIDVAINFDGSGSSDPEGSSLTYQWDFGDESSSNLENPSHSYSLDGNYSVTLTVTDDQGATGTDSTTVDISSLGGNPLEITGITPDTMRKGETTTVTISGTGFEADSSVEFEGAGFAPTVLITNHVDENTLEIEVTRGTNGPKKDFVYDVTVVNPSGDSFTLADSFLVTN